MHTQTLQAAIRKLLAERGEGTTICPSEVARALAASEARSAWEPLMEPVRKAAFLMADRGEIDVTQRGHIVEGRTAKGPIRLRRREQGL